MTEMWFWLATALLTLASAAVFVLPIWKGKIQDTAASREDLNKAFFRDRMDELKEESEEGLVDNEGELAVELKQSLLDDIPQGNKQSGENMASRWLLLPGLIVLVGMGYGLYMAKGNHEAVSQWQQTASNLPALTQRLMNENQQPLTDAEMADLTLALRTKLHTQPDDSMGWLLLGRIGLANRDIQTATGALEKAYRLDPGSNEIKLSYAQALMFTGEEDNGRQAQALLRDVIKADHSNLQAFSLLAFNAFERGAFDEAIASWSTMKTLLAEDDPRVAMLDRSIQRARSQMTTSGETVSVTIGIGSDVVMPSQGVLIVSVHSADGAPMPIAAKRLPLGNFPLTIELTDADSMIPERLLSSLPEVLVKARIDTDGNVMSKTGDWFGTSEPFALGTSSQITINQQY